MRPLEEQETVINYYRDSDVCTVYTSDSTIMTKLDKLVDNPDLPHWKLKQVHRLQDGELVGKTYETNKRLISFRADIGTRKLTEEQKQALTERLEKARASK